MSKDAINTSGAVRLRLPQRDQVLWQAQCLDDLLPKEHRARTLWAIVCKLDLSAESVDAYGCRHFVRKNLYDNFSAE